MDEPTFESDQEALSHYRNLAKNLQYDLDDTRTALDEFQISSKELEAELEKDLATTEKQLNELRGREEALAHEVDQWKGKYQGCLRDHTKTMTHMQGELDSLRKSNEEYRTRLRDMELDNDELEGKERMVTSSLQDVESKYGKAIERITLLEDELIEHTRLEEECQRLRDDLRDLTEEMAVMRDQLSIMQAANANRPSSQPQPQSQPQPLTPSTAPLSTTGSPQASPGSKNLPRSETNIKLSRSPTHFSRSPALRKAQQLSNSPDCTPRKRLVSLSINTSDNQSPTAIPRPLTTANMNMSKSSSLRITRRSAEIRPALHEVVASDTRIPTTGPSPSSALGKSIRVPNATSKLSTTPSLFETPINRNSHLQSLRAETQRMQGMTQKLVSSRTSRLVSAIPIPKPSLLATLSKSTNGPPATVSRIPGTRSPTKKPSIGAGLSAMSRTVNRRPTLTQPTTQDKDPSENDNSRRVARRSNAFTPAPTPMPPPKTRIARPASRLSMASDQPSQAGPSRSATPVFAIPRRKASIDTTSDRHSRPASTLGHYPPSHIRRKSAGVNALHYTKPDNLMHEDFAQQAAQLRSKLGKSLGPGATRPRPPAPTT